MLGPPKRHMLDHPIDHSLEELVPQDHFYRFLDEKLYAEDSKCRDVAQRVG